MASGARLDVELDAHSVAESILKIASTAKNEEELKIGVELTIRPVLEKWGITTASYEKRLEIAGREDALYGRVIIEYKGPGKLSNRTDFRSAKDQVKRYIQEEAGGEASRGRFFGVVLDGLQISFVRFRRGAWEEQDSPLVVKAQTILRLLEAIRGLRRKPIDAETLLVDFGPKSETSKVAILALYRALIDKNTPRTDMLFSDWKRVFSQVCSYSPDKLSGLVKYYGLEDKANVEKLLFSIHTYYTLLMKLLTSEIVTLFADSLLGSYLKRLEESYYRGSGEMLQELKDLEEGGIFTTVGIRNFLEADYFGWYTDEWNDEMSKAVLGIVTRLIEYEPATVELNPEKVEDLFKRLYQNLVPREIRHSIGEYFTPDWLAELVLDRVGIDGNPDLRSLDPACGSGTFLVMVLKRIREYAETNFIEQRDLLPKILENVQGIDLNPLAVLAAKANYIIALSDLLRYRPREGIEIPIHLADSISMARKATPYGEDEYELLTNEGRFWITKEVVEKNCLDPILSIIAEGVKFNLTKEQFAESISKRIPLGQQSINSVGRLYDKILKLEQVGKDRIWTSLLKNSFSPLLIGKFDFVIGNPPWINWESLPEFYRITTKSLWARYGLLETTEGAGLGKVKRDLAMLFVARCFEQYTNKRGKLGFLIPFTVYKTQAGAGFRNWLWRACRVQSVDDLVELYPFEGATNRTSLVVISGGRTTFPIPCTMYHNPRTVGMGMDDELHEVNRKTSQFQMILAPVRRGKPESPWMITSNEAYEVAQKVLGSNRYRAYAGIYSGLNGAYWANIDSRQLGEVWISNQFDIGKKKVRQVKTLIEPDLIYPLARARDLKKWYSKPSLYILVPHDPKTGNPLREAGDKSIKVTYPKTFDYFLKFQAACQTRAIHKLWGKKNPFYSVYDIGEYTFQPYKVAWKRIAGQISGKAAFSVCVLSEVQDRYLGKKYCMTDEKGIFIPFADANEAHYVASVLNSSVVRFFIASTVTEIHMAPSVIEDIKIPPFDPENDIHSAMSNLSKEAHRLAEVHNGQQDTEIAGIEDKIDALVGRLLSISNREMAEVKNVLNILLEGEGQEEADE